METNKLIEALEKVSKYLFNKEKFINCGRINQAIDVLIDYRNDINNDIPTTESKPLTFGELKLGDHFVDFPMDGDDSGHGGFRKGVYVFEKIGKQHDRPENAIRVMDDMDSTFPDTMQVYKIILTNVRER